MYMINYTFSYDLSFIDSHRSHREHGFGPHIVQLQV